MPSYSTKKKKEKNEYYESCKIKEPTNGIIKASY